VILPPGPPLTHQSSHTACVQAQLDLGRVAGLTCRIMLKEYPAASRALGDNELRAYEALWGSLPDERFPFSSLLEELPHLEDAAGATATLWPVPKLYGACRRVHARKPSSPHCRQLPYARRRACGYNLRMSFPVGVGNSC
jgi:hypothetical protein